MISLETRLKILKGVLMVNIITEKGRGIEKDENIKMCVDAAEKSGEDSLNLDEWIDWLRREVRYATGKMSAEERAQYEEEKEEEGRQLAEREYEYDAAYARSYREEHYRDEWDDRLDDIARSVGATRF